MYINVNFSLFCDSFVKMNRDNIFSYAAKRALFDYLEEYEDDCGEKIELDVIALCCDFTEYSLADALIAYDCDELDDLRYSHNVIVIDDENVIVQG